MADNRVMGAVTCPYCGCQNAIAKEMRSGAYVTCPPEHDGGCNSQWMGRSRSAKHHAAKKVSKWHDPQLKAEILAVVEPAAKPSSRKPKAAPQTVETPSPQPEPQPNPQPQPEAPKSVSLASLLFKPRKD